MIVLLSCVCDSITQKLCGNRSLSMVREAGTNYDDVRIVFVVCVTISVVVLIGAITFLVWKYQEIIYCCIVFTRSISKNTPSSLNMLSRI